MTLTTTILIIILLALGFLIYQVLKIKDLLDVIAEDLMELIDLIKKDGSQ